MTLLSKVITNWLFDSMLLLLYLSIYVYLLSMIFYILSSENRLWSSEKMILFTIYGNVDRSGMIEMPFDMQQEYLFVNEIGHLKPEN
jgi:hypothetical protein